MHIVGSYYKVMSKCVRQNSQFLFLPILTSWIYFVKKRHFTLKISPVLDKQFTYEKLVSLLHTCARDVTLQDATVTLRLTTRVRRAGVI